jgi:hypothetical protein
MSEINTDVSAVEQVLGRIAVNDRGIRKKPGWLFGRGFDLRWDDVEGWAVVSASLGGSVIDRILELHHKGGIEAVRSGDTGKRFDAVVSLVQERLPQKRVESIMQQMSRTREQESRRQ